MSTRFYSFRLDGGARSGLVRQVEDDEGVTLERVDRLGAWVDDPALIRHFVDPGDSKLVAITTHEARRRASAYSVEL